MNEVKSAGVTPPGPVPNTSSNGRPQEVPAGNETSATGNVLPPQISSAVERSEESEAENLGSAVAEVQEFVQSLQRELQFSVDEGSERTVVKVLDGESGEIIRQIPEDIFLELARRLKDDGEFRLLNAFG